MLMPPKPQVTVAQGYKIHITSDKGFDQETYVRVENIARNRGLSSFEDANGLMIYRKH